MARAGLCQPGKQLMNAKELRLQTRLGVFCGLHWPNPDAPRVMCLHGWLDNASSFTPLAPHLKDFDLIALDMAGHGYSDRRPAGARYYMMDNLWDLDAVLDALDWSECNLIGHSLGGGVASTYAATAPERVSRLITLDGLGPLSASPGDTVKRLKSSIESVRKKSSGLRDYPDIETAAMTRQKASGFSIEIARLLVERSLKHEDGVFRWSTDPALNWRSPTMLTEEQVIEILVAIEAPTLSIVCSQIDNWIDSEITGNRRSIMPGLWHRMIDSHHHFHMDQPQQTADFIIEFLNTPESQLEQNNA
ncbi:MAG: pimeloyl-ACP methyl ester carboxylesterase [Rhodothermales bacterium]|jgi:pimeloyl-ACP methyl ester carboxylesterase